MTETRTLAEILTVEGRIVTPEGIVRGRLRHASRILAIEPDDNARDELLIVPGFIDLHVHGGGGADVMDGADAVRTMARFHARQGTTTLLATTVTAPADELRRAFAGIAAARAAPAADGAEVLGVHLEGPFLNPEALGAQPPFAIAPDLGLVAELHATAPIRVATMAPEIDTDGRLLAWLVAHGVRPQIGHTRCSYAEAAAALAAGATGFTHLYNAMTGLHHRAPGAVGCALAEGDFAELILDFQHVEAGAALAARRAIPGLYAAVTDAVAACGMPDGTYHLGRHAIRKTGETVRLADGTARRQRARQAFANFAALGLDAVETVRRTSTLAADYLGLADRGRLVVGRRADLALIDAEGPCRRGARGPADRQVTAEKRGRRPDRAPVNQSFKNSCILGGWARSVDRCPWVAGRRASRGNARCNRRW
ncbi:MAG: amidohydrolase family protein [Geminicoccaceae bacterium]